MDLKQRRKRLMRALLAFSILLAVWVVLALQLSAASASPLGFPLDLRSSLTADYGTHPGGGPIASLRLSIVADFMHDLGLPLNEAESQGGGLLDELDKPVPTATALNFRGDPPFTPTPSPTPSPTVTPTATATNTRIPPSATPKPTKTEKPPKPTEAPEDSVKPTLEAGELFPPPGALGTCEASINVEGLRVIDPGPSSGMASVRLKYKILGPGSKGYVYSDPIEPSSGGWTDGPGSTWDATYISDVTIDFEKGYAALWAGGKFLARPILSVATETPTPTDTPEPTATPVPSETPVPTETPMPTETPVPEPFDIELWAIVEDNAGNSSYLLLGTYTMPASCES